MACAVGGILPGHTYADFFFPGGALAYYIETLHSCYAPDYVVSIMGVHEMKMKHLPFFHLAFGGLMNGSWINISLFVGYMVAHFIHSNFRLFPWLEDPRLALAAMAEEDYPGAAAAAPRREAAAAPRERPGPAPAPPRAERAAAGELKVGDAVTLVFPDTSANAPLSGQRGVVEALPGGEYPDRYVVFVAATADSDQRRLAVKREHLDFYARGL